MKKTLIFAVLMTLALSSCGKDNFEEQYYAAKVNKEMDIANEIAKKSMEEAQEEYEQALQDAQDAYEEALDGIDISDDVQNEVEKAYKEAVKNTQDAYDEARAEVQKQIEEAKKQYER